MLNPIRNSNPLDTTFFIEFSSLQFNKYLKTPWSIIKDVIGIISWTNVVIKSTDPYSSVDNNDVYSGSSKKVINWNSSYCYY